MSSSNQASREGKSILTRSLREVAGPWRSEEKRRALSMVLDLIWRERRVARGLLLPLLDEVYVSPLEILRSGSTDLGFVNSEKGM